MALSGRVTGGDCMTPPEWSAEAVESSALGFITHSILYSTANNAVRWERQVCECEGVAGGVHLSSRDR